MKPKANGKVIMILTMCAITVFAVVLGWLVPKTFTSYELHDYYNQLDVVASDEIYYGSFTLERDVSAQTCTDILDDLSYVAGYIYRNTATTANAECNGKEIDSTLIFKTGKWSDKNTYKVVEGNDLPSTFEGKTPILVSENQWKKHSIGDEVKITVNKTDGSADVIEAYIVGKISNTTAIAGVHYYFPEPNEGNIIIPDIGAEKYIANCANSFTVMLDMTQDGTMVSLIGELEGVARAYPRSERTINYSAIEEQQNKTEYLIYIAVAVVVALAAFAFFISKKTRALNCIVAAVAELLFTIIFTAVQFKKAPIFTGVENLKDFYQNAALYLQGSIVLDVVYFTLATVIFLCLAAVAAYFINKKEKAKIDKIEATDKLYD